MNPYDAVAYPSFPFDHAHPDRLATQALLFGLEPAPVEACRVLELGCGNGANLIPMAMELPCSRFAGIDLAAEPVESGRRLVSRLGLDNIELQQLDLMDVTREFGEFDYIIAHGLYSWVPRQVQDQLLEIAKANLAPQGVAYVSYNAYPGGHIKQMVREMLTFHAGTEGPPAERMRRAKEMLELAMAAQSGDDATPVFLRSEFESQLERDMAALYHDELSPSSEPIYFTEFVRRAADHGLQYVAEAVFHQMQDARFPPAVAERIRQFAGEDRIAHEQYLDFLKCRRFRRTLLCHAGQPVLQEPSAAAVRRMYAASQARAVSPRPEIDSDVVERFESPNGAGIQTAYPLAKAAIWQLGEVWPEPLAFPDLLQAIRPAASEDDAYALPQILLHTYSAGLVELHAHRFGFRAHAGERPEASPLARLQAAEGEIVTTLRHASLRLPDEVSRQVVMLLDGTRDRNALIAAIGALPGIADAPDVIAAKLEDCLQSLGQQGLLLA